MKRILQSDLLQKAIDNTKHMMDVLKLDHDFFMDELSKYSGVISGSFMMMNVLELPMECNDIDVYIFEKDYENRTKTDNYNTMSHIFHPFEQWMINKYRCDHVQKESYLFVDGIIYSRTYKTRYIDINVIILSEPCIDQINNFDLDCCKICYDGTDIKIYDPDNLFSYKTHVRYNKCSSKNLAIGSVPRSNSHASSVYNLHGYVHNSLAFIKYQMFYDVYKYQKGKLKSFPKYKYYTHIMKHNGKNRKKRSRHCAASNYLLFDAMVKTISKVVDLDMHFDRGHIGDLTKVPITETTVKIISMIRTLERIEKYRGRGIVEFIFD